MGRALPTPQPTTLQLRKSSNRLALVAAPLFGGITTVWTLEPTQRLVLAQNEQAVRGWHPTASIRLGDYEPAHLCSSVRHTSPARLQHGIAITKCGGGHGQIWTSRFLGWVGQVSLDYHNPWKSRG